MRLIRCFAFCLAFFASLCANAQVLRLGSDNRRTIEATTTEKISVPSDSAIVKIGFNHIADTKDTAYTETVRMGAKIIKALIDAGISKEEIQTDAVNVGREEEPLRNTSSSPKIRYSAAQQWRIHVVAADAQKTIDIAVTAGANSVQGVEWNVSDPQSLRAKAYGVALARAKEMAEQSASQAGVKLGELISVINGEESEGFAKLPMARKMVAVEVQATPMQNLVLYPGKVEREATVTLIFAIAQ
ncbi:MAG TPA: SIMPL domain-containing protein [Candidatus Acidoferrum sp.]|nr:SIMPL domain-containing protein [Candidatus Acidoferrum sp.]